MIFRSLHRHLAAPCQVVIWRRSFARPWSLRTLSRNFQARSHHLQEADSSRSAKATAHGHLSAATILTRNNATPSAESILASIEPLHTTPPVNSTPKTSIVLLCTKALTPLATYEQFLQQFIDRLTRNKDGESSIEAVDMVTAVVDQLPAPSVQRQNAAQQERDSPAELLLNTLSSEHEGISYLVDTGGQVLKLDEFTTASPISIAKSISHDKPGVLSLRVSSSAHVNRLKAAFEVPLANTLFTNGNRATLVFSQWQRDKGQNTYKLTSFTSNSNASIELIHSQHSGTASIPDTSSVNNVDSQDLYLPFKSITPFRIVADSTGNVIRRLEDETGTLVGASQELEQAISEYFNQFNLEPQTVSVWALVIPASLHKSVDTHILEPSQLLRLGATLHRVLSGGGGWGAKAGLISLDSQAGFAQSSRSKPIDFSALTSTADLFEKDGLGRPIAQLGDYLGFYVVDPTLSLVLQSRSKAAQDQTMLRFGTCTEAGDTITQPAIDKDQDSGDDHIEVIKGQFGALSEMGIGLHQALPDGVSMSQFKLDVPHSRLNYRFLSPLDIKGRFSNTTKRNFSSCVRMLYPSNASITSMSLRGIATNGIRRYHTTRRIDARQRGGQVILVQPGSGRLDRDTGGLFQELSPPNLEGIGSLEEEYKRWTKLAPSESDENSSLDVSSRQPRIHKVLVQPFGNRTPEKPPPRARETSKVEGKAQQDGLTKASSSKNSIAPKRRLFTRIISDSPSPDNSVGQSTPLNASSISKESPQRAISDYERNPPIRFHFRVPLDRNKPKLQGHGQQAANNTPKSGGTLNIRFLGSNDEAKLRQHESYIDKRERVEKARERMVKDRDSQTLRSQPDTTVSSHKFKKMKYKKMKYRKISIAGPGESSLEKAHYPRTSPASSRGRVRGGVTIRRYRRRLVRKISLNQALRPSDVASLGDQALTKQASSDPLPPVTSRGRIRGKRTFQIHKGLSPSDLASLGDQALAEQASSDPLPPATSRVGIRPKITYQIRKGLPPKPKPRFLLQRADRDRKSLTWSRKKQVVRDFRDLMGLSRT